ncbi:HNH endonuclease [Rhodococcus hoagii]|nr:HNH endonuclease [Prescottella equi]
MGRRGPKARPIVERFSEKIQPLDDGCVAWTGTTNGLGYGTIKLPDGSRIYAHRWSYEHHVGPIPNGLHLDHLCRNRGCVNPKHLEPVSIKENVLRGVGFSAVNARKTHCPQGHPYSGSNLYTNPTTGSRVCVACRRKRDAARTSRRLTRKAARHGSHRIDRTEV